MNEAETRAELLDPVLRAVGWGLVDASRVRRKHLAKDRTLDCQWVEYGVSQRERESRTASSMFSVVAADLTPRTSKGDFSVLRSARSSKTEPSLRLIRTGSVCARVRSMARFWRACE